MLWSRYERTGARRLTPLQQQALRQRAVALVQEGKPQTETARELGVSRSAVAKWIRAWRTQGRNALALRPRGRPAGAGRLTESEKSRLLEALCNHTPDHLALPSRVWGRRAIRDLMDHERFPSVTSTTISAWMRQWGFSVSRPAIGANAEYDEAVSQSAVWRLAEFPRIKRLARKLNGRILLFNENPLPTVPSLDKRPSIMLCAVDGRGTLYFSVTRSPVTVLKRTDFMERLALDIGRHVFILLDSRPIHRNSAIRKWERRMADRITLVYIPITDLRCFPAECWPFGTETQERPMAGSE